MSEQNYELPTYSLFLINQQMASNPKQSNIPPDELIHDQLDEVNKKEYYQTVQREIRESCKQTGVELNEKIIEQEMEKYVESFRNYYYTSQILTNNKSNQFFEEVVRELHPTVKLKGPIKGLLKTICKVFVQQLAQTTLEVGNLTGRMDAEIDVVCDAYELMERRRSKRNNIGKLFKQMY